MFIGLAIAVAPGFADPSMCDAMAGNLVRNCGFESGFNYWTVSNNDFGADGNTQVVSGEQNSGDYFAALGTIGKDVNISQSFNDTFGTQYWFSFYVSAPNADSPSDFSAEWNGTILVSEINPAWQGYEEYSYLVTGTGNDTITFLGRDDPTWVGLDDVYVGLPEPSLLWTGGLLLIFLLGNTWSAKFRSKRALPF